MKRHMRCIVCASQSERVVWRENGYEGRACRCGTVYTWPPPPAGTIDPTHDGHSDVFYATYASLKARWVQRIYPCGRLVEIGCGEGHFLAAAKSLGYEVCGVEPDSGRARRVRSRLGIEVHCSTLEDLQWDGLGFDIVYHCDLLSHFADPVQALRTMSGLVSPNGLLVFEAGTLAGIRQFWYDWIGSLGFPDHRWLYSEDSLFKLLHKAGLRVVKRQHFGLAPAVAF